MSEKRDIPPPMESPPELDRAGVMLEAALQGMMKAGVHPHMAATAMLGGAMHIFASGLPEDKIILILENAIAGVRAGHLRQFQKR